MDAEAWGLKRMDKIHNLAARADFRREDMAPNGSVSITFNTEDSIMLNGQFYVKLTFTAAEIDKMYRLSLVGMTKGRLEPKPAGTGQFIRRIFSC